MSANRVNDLVEIIGSNAAAVLSTITNSTIEYKPTTAKPFSFDAVSQALDLPSVLLTINFTGDQDFQILHLLSKKLVAMLSDLMMLGDGNVDYFPEEHNDAVQEMFNQVLGSVTSDLVSQGMNVSGSVSQVELTDLGMQKDFLEDNSMVPIDVSILDQRFTLFMFFDSFAEGSVENLFLGAPPQKTAPKESPAAAPKKAPKPQEHREQPPIPVSRASFAEIDDGQQTGYSNINIELLHDIVLPITVELGRKEMRIKEILEMGQGSVIELDKTAGDYVDLIVNGKKFAIGEVMVADENYAVRIVSLVSRKERIKSLG